MDDKSTLHRIVDFAELLEREDIHRTNWPARSPDLYSNLTHVLILGRFLVARHQPSAMTSEMRLALQVNPSTKSLNSSLTISF